MKIYKLWASGEDGHYLAWASTRADVRVKRAELTEATGATGKDIVVTRIEFPTDQAAIVGWLNRNFNMANG